MLSAPLTVLVHFLNHETNAMKSFLLLLCMFVVPVDETAKTDAPKPQLTPELSVFEPLVGKTFRGEFVGSTPEKPMFDVSKWERAMNGKAIRVLHSVNDGEYGGETVVMWDAKEKKIGFWYFTTAGFYTQGHFEIDGKKWTSVEKVTGNSQGITEVKATSFLEDDGTLKVSSQYLTNGKWEKGHEINYKTSPDAEVKFK